MTIRIGALLAVTAMLLAACKPQNGGTTGTTAKPSATPETATTDPGPEEGPAPAAPNGAEQGEPAAVVGPAPPTEDDQAALEAQVRELLGQVAMTYRNAPAIVDHIVITETRGGNPAPGSEIDIRLGPGTDAQIVTRSQTLTTVDGMFYLEPADRDRYYAVPMEQDLLGTLVKHFGGYRGVMSHMAFRFNKPYEEVLYTISFGVRGQTRVDGYRQMKHDDGRTLHEIRLISADGSVYVRIDPETMLVIEADIEWVEPNAPIANWRITRHMEFDTKILDALPEPIAFDAGGRIGVHHPSLLVRRQDESFPVRLAFEKGDPAPPFTLYTIEGERYELSEARGRPVVLVFWDTNSPTCVRALPGIVRTMQSMESDGVPVEIVLVHSPDGADAMKQHEEATGFFSRNDIPVTTLLDVDAEVTNLYGVLGVPTYLILDADGDLFDAFGGGLDDFQATLMERLQPLLDG